ncbi:hypothetical protein A2160_04770 [Candidatus Beckwithbacteria bacterium RBG_13_42_9]|uniref:Transcription regulator TrmB N-terminal domain-containing protein n=1 Tax=Candidatus Beckwithbacteria bacterium RBG_13_42_9 TaxID=1797457 RepID=A0A1F5E606_9BACT|nr:MAG: hypothetical protein A2160_04770 [Candidatus Beckwithbacteria bacterium RBG_13_42_9]
MFFVRFYRHSSPLIKSIYQFFQILIDKWYNHNVMSDQSDNLKNILTPFGLSPEEAAIYLFLLEKGFQSALQASRVLHLGRTKVYRLLDKLAEKGLVTKKIDDLGLKFEAASPKQLELLVTQKSHEVEVLRDSLPLVFKELGGVRGKGADKTKVLYYSGTEGLKQVTWNSTKAKNELYLFELSTMSAFLDYGFCEKARKEFVHNKVEIRALTNLRHVPAWTKVAELVKKYYQCRFIDPDQLKVIFEQLIYNDVYCLYNYQGGEIFCVEIYNQHLADMQKQLFNYMWLKAKRMKLRNNEGEVVV